MRCADCRRTARRGSTIPRRGSAVLYTIARSRARVPAHASSAARARASTHLSRAVALDSRVGGRVDHRLDDGDGAARDQDVAPAERVRPAALAQSLSDLGGQCAEGRRRLHGGHLGVALLLGLLLHHREVVAPCHQGPSGAIRGHQGPSGAIRGHQEQSGASITAR
eukprot:4961450-Prymnesium_polylepis.1